MTALLRNWIAGLSRITRPPTAHAREAGMLAGIISKCTTWFGGLPERASSARSHPRVVGVVDFYHPVLDEVGEQVGCWRLRGERDQDFAFRLGTHITATLNENEALLTKVLDYKR